MHAKKFKQLFLHIGLGKTGTTTIQQDILANAELLETKYDVHYPRRFSHADRYEGNHSVLLRALFSNAPAVRQRLSEIGIPDQQAIDKFNKLTTNRLLRSFEKTSADQLLLSAESVGHFRQAQMTELFNWLNELSESITVVACLRHPVHALSSEIQQRLKKGEDLETMYTNPPHYLFKKLFTRLEKAFGKENLIAYSFADAVQQDCGLTAAFFRQIGIVADDDFPKSKPINTSISHEGALLLSSVNRQRPVMLEGARNPARNLVDIDFFRDLPGRTYRAPTEVYNLVKERVEVDVQWVEQEYDIDLGRPEQIEVESYRSLSEQSVDFIAEKLVQGSSQRHSLIKRQRHPLTQKVIDIVAHPSLIFYKALSLFGIGRLSSK